MPKLVCQTPLSKTPPMVGSESDVFASHPARCLCRLPAAAAAAASIKVDFDVASTSMSLKVGPKVGSLQVDQVKNGWPIVTGRLNINTYTYKNKNLKNRKLKCKRNQKRKRESLREGR